MQREMEVAIASELYERAAELRDAIKLLKMRGNARLARDGPQRAALSSRRNVAIMLIRG